MREPLPVWVKPVAGVAAATLFLGVVLKSCENDATPEPSTALSADAQTAACERAGIVLRPGSDHGIVIDHPSKPAERYLRNLADETLQESVATANGAIVLPTTDRVPLPAGRTVEEQAKKSGFSASALECLNAIPAKASFPKDTSVRVPRLTFDKNGNQVVVHSGDTLLGIAGKYCGTAATTSVISELGIDPTKLRPGDVVTVQCETSEAGQQSAEITSANAELSNFVTKYGGYADEVEKQYGVPRELTLAMGALESGYGTSKIAVNLHNFHGLKANEEWFGPIYEEITQEVVPEEKLGDFDIIGEPRLRSDGRYEITIHDYFKVFSSDEEGFLGFGEHLRTRFKGTAYADAFGTDDPIEFVERLFDSTGNAYATDPEYVKKVTPLIEAVQALENPAAESEPSTSDSESSPRLDIPAWEELSDADQRQFGSSDVYESAMSQLAEARPNFEDYEAFVTNIIDKSDDPNYLSSLGFYSDHFFPDQTEYSEPPRLMLHYTGWPESAWDLDGESYVSSAFHNGENGNGWGLAPMYLERDGKTLWVFTDRPTWHASQYSLLARGIETPAGHQNDITTEQYTGLLYAAAWVYMQDHPSVTTPPSVDELIVYIIGHGEATNYGYVSSGDSHSDFPLQAANLFSEQLQPLLAEIVSKNQ